MEGFKVRKAMGGGGACWGAKGAGGGGGGGGTDFKLSSLGETPFFVHGGLTAVRVVCLNESFFRLWTSGNSQAWHRERNLNRI